MGDLSTYQGLKSDADKIAYLKLPGNGNLVNQLNAQDPSFKNWFQSADYATRSGQYDPTTNTNYDAAGAPARSFAVPTAAQLTNPAAQQTAPQSTAPAAPLTSDPAPTAAQGQLANAMTRRGNWGGGGQPATRNYSAGQYAPQMPGGGQAPTFNTAYTGQAPTYYGQATAQAAQQAQPQAYGQPQPQINAQQAAAQLQQLGQAYGNAGGGSVGGKGGGQSSFAAPQASAPGGKGGGGTPGGKGSGGFGSGYSAALQNAGGTPGGKGGGRATGNMGMGYGQQALNYSA